MMKRYVSSALGRLNPTASIAAGDGNSAVSARLLASSVFDAADANSDPRPWLAISAHTEHASRYHHDDCAQEHDHLHDKSVESFVLFRDDPLSRAELQFLLDGISGNLGPGLLRVKGLVNVAEEPGRPAVIQGAQHLLHTMTWLAAWPDADQRTRVVFITQGIVRDKLKEIIELLDRVSARTYRARERGRLAQKAALEHKDDKT